MENTLENKAKFFAQYWGHMYTYKNDFGTFKEKVGDFHFRTDVSKEECFLSLKPLSSISDEDAFVLGCLMVKDPEDYISATTHNDSLGVWLKMERENGGKGFYLNLNLSVVVDKARELGYAADWNGLSVEKQIEYGWIKLIN